MLRSKSPDVSIIVPLHNKELWIQDTIESVLNQTMSNWEMLVVENGSIDQGPNIVEQNRDPRIQLLQASLDVKGPGAARNYGLNGAKGEWVLFLDADDLIEKDHLESLLSVASTNSAATIIAGGWKTFDKNNPTELSNMRPVGESGGLIDSAIAASPWAVHATLLQRALVEEISWPEDMDGMLAEDNHFWFTICLWGTVVFSKSSGALYRQNTEDCRTQSGDIVKWFDGVHTAATKNVEALKQKTGQQPNVAQSTSLMQLYSTLFTQAKQEKNSEYTLLALEQAEYWLAQTGSLLGKNIPLIARRVFGIALIESLKLNIQGKRSQAND